MIALTDAQGQKFLIALVVAPLSISHSIGRSLLGDDGPNSQNKAQELLNGHSWQNKVY